MQIKPFTNGGGVIHKVKLMSNATVHYSVWFNAEYEITDIEGIRTPTHQAVRTITKGGPLWNRIAQYLNPAHIKVLAKNAPQPNQENGQALPEVAPGAEDTSVRGPS